MSFELELPSHKIFNGKNLLIKKFNVFTSRDSKILNKLFLDLFKELSQDYNYNVISINNHDILVKTNSNYNINVNINTKYELILKKFNDLIDGSFNLTESGIQYLNHQKKVIYDNFDKFPLELKVIFNLYYQILYNNYSDNVILIIKNLDFGINAHYLPDLAQLICMLVNNDIKLMVSVDNPYIIKEFNNCISYKTLKLRGVDNIIIDSYLNKGVYLNFNEVNYISLLNNEIILKEMSNTGGEMYMFTELESRIGSSQAFIQQNLK